jgi:hypothetical protein
VTGTITFYPDGLLDKHGFEDGDMLFDLVEEHGLAVDHRDLLARAVERLVVPLLDQNVEAYVIGTFHNPIRARSVDGEKPDLCDTLTPQIIEIPISDILAIAAGLSRTWEDGL